jgi:hypothetical protein
VRARLKGLHDLRHQAATNHARAREAERDAEILSVQIQNITPVRALLKGEQSKMQICILNAARACVES